MIIPTDLSDVAGKLLREHFGSVGQLAVRFIAAGARSHAIGFYLEFDQQLARNSLRIGRC